jgi:hypothetical protein
VPHPVRRVNIQKSPSSAGGINTAVALIMEVTSTSETSVNFYQTIWCNNPEDILILDYPDISKYVT